MIAGNSESCWRTRVPWNGSGVCGESCRGWEDGFCRKEKAKGGEKCVFSAFLCFLRCTYPPNKGLTSSSCPCLDRRSVVPPERRGDLKRDLRRGERMWKNM